MSPKGIFLPAAMVLLGPVLWILTASEIGVLMCSNADGQFAFCDVTRHVSRASFSLVVALAMFQSSLRERALAVAAGVCILLAVQRADAAEVIFDAADLGAFFAVFIAMLTMITEAARRSISVAEVGRYLIEQPPGRRYYSIAVGSHILGIFLNFGAVSLLSPLIQKGAKAAQNETPENLERRQLSALLRGFSWILLWAPTTLSQAVLLTLFPGVDYARLLGIGICSAVVMILLGRFVDRLEWRSAQTVPGHAIAVPWGAVKSLSAICLGLIVTTYLLVWATPFTVAQALTCVAPVLAVGWVLGQFRRHGPRGETVSGIFNRAAPSLARSAIALGLSGFLGRMAVTLVPSDAVAAVLTADAMPGWLFLAILPAICTLGGQIAISPMTFVVFLGGALSGVDVLPTDPTLIVFALSVGWALSMTASPNATATLLISATCHIPPTTLTWKWNGRFALAAYALACCGFYGLDRAFGLS